MRIILNTLNWLRNVLLNYFAKSSSFQSPDSCWPVLGGFVIVISFLQDNFLVNRWDAKYSAQ